MGSRKRVIFISTGISAVIAYLGIGFGLPNLFNIGADWSYLLRYVVALIFTIALGIPMGIPFPIGMGTIRDLKLKGIPWAWSINGVASVLGSLLSVLLSQIFGISSVALLGAICYVFAGFVFNSCVVRGDYAKMINAKIIL